ncbi:SWI/SNF chromatin-remodeling complex subunit sol1 [Fulvia fulva]|uniref:SWI/SNF chromatin-remodeling complex subunit sol1 n=1 Tax=Passalora fulva TaxID=5499 RepID=A0A9Q8PJR7_PASFU|nr:SWI/SNF chromatin-remodeling complex subunit sol1 [Fulvia fulva]KAK4611945.1 SWI/SNF chromatin-remodeling complex subunit sol1 [Fulvia fulva]KAK4612827.1 SWI/SNF chromatin-remodeling complex subunit sol1 [Fulvia fulva]UJO23748.1 SWI/SNF chromatin-remodeling complex subunit sol1 [Fulvia fulva]WPV21080.1 SWI/SNF chromatin-remodeling complex subunit sol1 [Fulvia fulva]WPV36626.1 SWI/SNF chromatin-remodeling complex subunit sol1 [Fulvia fulva]
MNPAWQNGQPNMFTPGQPHMNPQQMYANLTANRNFDINHFTPGLPNGAGSQSHTPQPQQTFNPTFTPGSAIPAKRPHDGMSGSPQQPSQQSRSQTPSYNLPNQQQFPNAPTPYQHLQQPGSNNATPSPTMQNQQFRPPQQQQPQPNMGTASPSPFPGQNRPPFYANNMSPAPQNQGNAGQYNMNPAMSMGGMPSALQAQMMNNNNLQPNAQRAYQLKLMQHQAQLRQSGMVGPQRVGGQPGQMPGMSGMQAGGQMANGSAQAMQAQQLNQKRAGFMKQLANHASQQGRPFNSMPMISGKPVDMFALWTMVTQLGTSSGVDRSGQWATVANKIGFPPAQYPNAAEELKSLYAVNIAQYERMWLQVKMQQKQEAARIHAQQMAGFSGQQQSPTKMMPPSGQQNQYQQFQQAQQSQQPSQTTPVQAHASLPQNGMSTPQQMMGGAAALHRRNSSVRKPDQMTPQAAATPGTTASPLAVKPQRPASVKQESSGPVMKSEEPQSTNYQPQIRSIESDGGYDIAALFDLGSAISRAIPNHPTVDEMGVIDTKAITLSLASGIHGEVRYALDTLAVISHDQRVQVNLEQCEDLMDVVVDCAEDQTEALSDDAAEVSDALDLPAYEDIMRSAKVEAEMLQDVPEYGSHAYKLDRAADKVIAITTILRNFSFYEINHRLLTAPPLIKWLSNTIRLLGTRNMLLRTYYNTQDFYKDMIIFLSNVTQSLELPSRDDALHILHFLLSFSPQPAPSYMESGGKVRFTSFQPAYHRYLPPAIDCLAKLLARQDPNRMLYKSIFSASSSSLAVSESPLDLLTRAFALSISVLPDRTKGSLSNSTQLRIVEARKAYLTQGMLAADILTTLAPSNDSDLARAWIESEDGWAVGLLNLAALLSVDRNQQTNPAKSRELGMDTESFKLITYRALTMIKRLAEKAGKGSLQNIQQAMTTNGDAKTVANGAHDEDDHSSNQPKWEGIPQGHAILGALMMPSTDKVALGLLCGLHDMTMQQVA